MRKFLKFLTSFMITFIVIFTITFLSKLLIDALIFSQRAVNYKYIIILVPIVMVASILLTLFFQLNKVTVFIQASVVYLTLILVIYSFGIISGWFTFENLTFSGIVLAFNILGFTIVALIIMLLKKRLNLKLNDQLKLFKERDQHEKN
ncbi:MAG: hypothetical protein IKC22_05535 [Bacilli bacterium]|nr:hypothetical protein [Bacilli bacterium]